MAQVYEGKLTAQGKKLGIVAARFNEFISAKLIEGARDCFLRHGGEDENFHVYWVPGAWELPCAAKRLSKKGTYDAVVCVGAVIRGATPHFDYVASESAKGIAQVGLLSDVPVIFGVLTTDNIEQAIERAGTKSGNKGWDSTLAAIEMMNLLSDHLL